MRDPVMADLLRWAKEDLKEAPPDLDLVQLAKFATKARRGRSITRQNGYSGMHEAVYLMAFGAAYERAHQPMEKE